jgi:hypothetical protein
MHSLKNIYINVSYDFSKFDGSKKSKCDGTTRGNSYLLKNQKKGGYEMGMKVKVCDYLGIGPGLLTKN